MKTLLNTSLYWTGFAGALLGVALLGFRPSLSTAASAAIDPARSLFVTDRAVLDSDRGQLFSLRRVFDQLVAQSHVAQLTRQTLWQQWWDTLNPSPGLGLGPNCDSRTTSTGLPGMNGFPIDCPRAEGGETAVSPFLPQDAPLYRPTALVNRFDLAPPTGEHCGEHRIVFARTSRGLRNFLIFEAVMPNPTPEDGLEGCRPVAQFWARLSSIDDPHLRARQLARFYFVGLPGFAPVVQINHYITGQIRTNMFIESVWQLREFKLAHRCSIPNGPCGSLRIMPVPVKSNPFGELFDDTATHAKASGFRTDFLQRLPSLLPDNLMGMSLHTAKRFDAGQSSVHGETDYAAHLEHGAGRFSQALQRQLRDLGSDLTPAQVVNRAMTQSCAGCHQLSSGRDLGHELTWPFSMGFVHVDEGGNTSPALQQVFLPHRLAVLQAFLSRAPLPMLVTPDSESETVHEQTPGGPRRTH